MSKLMKIMIFIILKQIILQRMSVLLSANLTCPASEACLFGLFDIESNQY